MRAQKTIFGLKQVADVQHPFRGKKNDPNRTNLIKLCGLNGCGGLVVSMLAFYSNDPSSNPAEVYSFYRC